MESINLAGSEWRPRGSTEGFNDTENPTMCADPWQNYNLSSPIRRMLQGRGVTHDQISDYIAPSFKSLRDPLAVKDMSLAVSRLIRAFLANEKVAIYADYDLDGSSALALMKEALGSFGFRNLISYQPKRLSEGYGVHLNAIQNLADLNTNVMLTVDVGIMAHAALEKAAELGMDVIVTDHHLPGESLPRAVAVVNPNRSDCTSQLGHLAGVGVAFYLCLALKREMENQNLLKAKVDLKKFLDLFVIGTLTDMVPLIKENRVLVRHGLGQLSRTLRPGLRQLVKHFDLYDRNLSSQEVAFQLTPKLNALSRLEAGILPAEIFLTDNEDQAAGFLEFVKSNNERRKSLQRSAEEKVFMDEGILGQKKFKLICHESFHKGIIGLVATKLCQSFSAPAFVGSMEVSGKIVGSARAPEGSGVNLIKVLEQSRELLISFGGHAKAAGFSLKQENLKPFEFSLEQTLKDFQVEDRVYEYDSWASLSDFDFSFLGGLRKLEPFGVAFPEPVFRIKAEVVDLQDLKGGHKKFLLKESDILMEMLYFSPPAKWKDLSRSTQGAKIEALVKLQVNRFGRREKLQIIADDVRFSY